MEVTLLLGSLAGAGLPLQDRDRGLGLGGHEGVGVLEEAREGRDDPRLAEALEGDGGGPADRGVAVLERLAQDDGVPLVSDPTERDQGSDPAEEASLADDLEERGDCRLSAELAEGRGCLALGRRAALGQGPEEEGRGLLVFEVPEGVDHDLADAREVVALAEVLVEHPAEGRQRGPGSDLEEDRRGHRLEGRVLGLRDHDQLVDRALATDPSQGVHEEEALA